MEPQRHESDRRATLRRRVLSAATRVGFTRRYNRTDHVLPPDVVTREIDDDEAVRELIRKAAVALGVATETDLRGLLPARRQTGTRDRGAHSAGELEPIEVHGWAHRHTSGRPDSAPPRPRRRAAVPVRSGDLLPGAVERIFDFRYRIEIYTPPEKRKHGYYVWPFLLDGEFGRSRRPQGRTHQGRTARGRCVRRAQARTVGGWPRRWRPSS